MGVGVHKQTLLLDYTSMTLKQLEYPTILKGKHNCFYLSICFYKSELRWIQATRNRYIYPKEPSLSYCFSRINGWNLWIWWKCQWIICFEATDESKPIFAYSNSFSYLSNIFVEMNVYIRRFRPLKIEKKNFYWVYLSKFKSGIVPIFETPITHE